MSKVLIILRREYGAMVRTKAFIISIVLMPVLMFGVLALQFFLESRPDVATKTIVVFDGTGQLFDRLAERAENRDIRNEKNEMRATKSSSGRLVFERGSPASPDDKTRLAYSAKTRRGEVFAFIEIGSEIIDDPGESDDGKVAFYAENIAFNKEREWFRAAINDLVRETRLKNLGVDADLVKAAITHVPFEALTLYEEAPDGEAKRADLTGSIVSSLLPFGVLMLIFFTVMVSAQPLLQSVIEEKQQNIAEVLLGAVGPTELMLGKLLGNIAVSFTVLGIYLVGGYALAVYFIYTALFEVSLLGWFVVFELGAALLYGSVFISIGAACNELKETQSLIVPVMIVAILPLMLWTEVVGDPSGAVATALSFFPLTAPMLMMARLTATSAIPAWQPMVSAFVTFTSAGLFVVGAGRIFRIGILARGKAPTFAELIRWAIRE